MLLFLFSSLASTVDDTERKPMMMDRRVCLELWYVVAGCQGRAVSKRAFDFLGRLDLGLQVGSRDCFDTLANRSIRRRGD